MSGRGSFAHNRRLLRDGSLCVRVCVQAQLQVSVQDLQEMIRQRLCKMEELRQSVSELEVRQSHMLTCCLFFCGGRGDLCSCDVQRVSVQAAVEQETAGSLRVFSALVSAIERSQAELMEVMEMTLRAAEHRVNAMIQQLQLEVEELQRRGVVLTELMQSDDYIHCVKVCEGLLGLSHGTHTRSVHSTSSADLLHHQQSSIRQRLVRGVGDFGPGNRNHLQVAGCAAG